MDRTRITWENAKNCTRSASYNYEKWIILLKIGSRTLGRPKRDPARKRGPCNRIGWEKLFAKANLLQGHSGAGLFQLALDLLGLLLVHALGDGLRSALDDLLGLLQAQAGDLADNLDDGDLVVAEALELRGCRNGLCSGRSKQRP